MVTLIVILSFVFLLVLIYGGRMIYQRSVRLRNRLQMEQMFTNISHELLTPLTVISASVERLRSQEPRYGTDYALMELNIERMVRLLQQILETSKSQSGNLRLLVSQGDVMKYISQTALCIEPLMYKKGLEFNIHCTPRSMMGWIDTDKLDKIIYNLLSNAAKYTGPNGKVDIDVHTNSNYDQVIIKVSDNGIGISSSQMRHLFQRFQDGNYRRTNTIGTGLGLALTRDLVELHGGTIQCDSKEGCGTVFTVVLPISKESFSESQIDEQHPVDLSVTRSAIIDLEQLIPQPDAPQAVTIDLVEGDSYKVLVVEDNNDLLMLMRTLLSRKYRVVTAQNGVEALEIIRQQEPDLIVSDVMMPEMDGNELTRCVKSSPEWSHLPVILLSAKTQEEDRKQSMLIGADDYITKPFRFGDLELRIDNLIENRKRIRRDVESNAEQEQLQQPPSADELFISRARQCVFDHLSDSDFDRDAFASEMGASTSTLYNRLRSITGKNVSTFIRDIRLQEACRLAQTQTDLRVSDLAYRVGFKDPKYFATSFKKQFGLQPSEYMEQVVANKNKDNV